MSAANVGLGAAGAGAAVLQGFKEQFLQLIEQRKFGEAEKLVATNSALHLQIRTMKLFDSALYAMIQKQPNDHLTYRIVGMVCIILRNQRVHTLFSEQVSAYCLEKIGNIHAAEKMRNPEEAKGGAFSKHAYHQAPRYHTEQSNPQPQPPRAEQTRAGKTEATATEESSLIKQARELLDKVRNLFASDTSGRFDAEVLRQPTTPSSSAYAVLGLKSDASEARVKHAYKKLSLQLHPDKSARNGFDQLQAEEAFKLINKAYKEIIPG